MHMDGPTNGRTDGPTCTTIARRVCTKKKTAYACGGVWHINYYCMRANQIMCDGVECLSWSACV